MLGPSVPRAALQPPTPLVAQCAAGQAGQSVAASDLSSKTPGYRASLLRHLPDNLCFHLRVHEGFVTTGLTRDGCFGRSKVTYCLVSWQRDGHWNYYCGTLSFYRFGA